jgi:hypothetical protein
LVESEEATMTVGATVFEVGLPPIACGHAHDSEEAIDAGY